MAVLSIDAGTTGVTVLVVSDETNVLAHDTQDFPQHFPGSGWVEHDPDDIWRATLAAVRNVLRSATAPISCVGVTNQRETAVFWHRRSLAAARPAIVWQDRRSAPLCDQLREAGYEDVVTSRTGLRLDPYFFATKLGWVAEHEPELWQQVVDGDVVVGTVDSYVIARLTGGRRHVTDASNASRTLLFDIHSGEWSDELCTIFGVPRDALPDVVPSTGVVGITDPGAFLGLAVPISGVAGDQQAALFGQTAFSAGRSKCTYGTGSFVLTNTGSEAPTPHGGLLTTVAFMGADRRIDYAVEGAIFVTGAAVQWLRDGLGIIAEAADTAELARSVPDSGGVSFVPALTGLGAPFWDPTARGLIGGISRGTTAAHLVRATLEAIAYSVRAVADQIADATGQPLTELAVDGGAARNDVLCQLQADQLGITVRRPRVLETTGLGAAFLAGLATGVWASQDELRASWQLDAEFHPGARDDASYQRWLAAVERARGWTTL